MNDVFLYNSLTTTFTTFDDPAESYGAYAGISDSNLFGSYEDAGDNSQGFLYQIAPVQSDFTPTVNWGGAVTGTPTVSVQLVSQTASGSTWKVVGNATYAFGGNATPTVTITDATGNSVQTNKVTFHVSGPAAIPITAVANGPYTVVVGSTLSLDATGSNDPNAGGAIAQYQWDLNGDGVFDVTTTSATTSVPWSTLAAARCEPRHGRP